ncbi:S9 family peptidase, partial [Bacteroidota bacterium]
MKKVNVIFLFIGIIVLLACTEKQTIKYPDSKKVDITDNYFGTEVADPYRWLEDDKSEETAKWVEEQNKVTQDYLSNIGFRSRMNERLTELWDYERYSDPSKKGNYYFYYKNDGLQEQSVLYYQKGLDGETEVFLDPNTFSDDGSVSLADKFFSKDHKYCSYYVSKGGSDWREIYVMEVESKNLLEDHILWAKFTEISWYNDGFY